MQRVLIIGPGGAGKSTLAVQLAALTRLPLVHLDALFWAPGWKASEPATWHAKVERAIAADRWVMDGNYGGSLDQRLAACDTVIFLDLPRHTCLSRVVQRRLRHRGRSRPDMTPGCPERLSLSFLWWIWRYRAKRRPRVLQRLAKLRPDQHVLHLQTQKQIDALLARLAAQSGTDHGSRKH